MASQSAVRKKVSTSFGKLRPPGTPVRVTKSVTRARAVRGDSEEADGRCEEMVEILASRTEDGDWQGGEGEEGEKKGREVGSTETVKPQVLTTSERGETDPVADKVTSVTPGLSQGQTEEEAETVLKVRLWCE